MPDDGSSKDATAGPTQDAKAKFREALERKKDKSHPTADGAENTGVVHGPEKESGGPKFFRRKTG